MSKQLPFDPASEHGDRGALVGADTRTEAFAYCHSERSEESPRTYVASLPVSGLFSGVKEGARNSSLARVVGSFLRTRPHPQDAEFLYGTRKEILRLLLRMTGEGLRVTILPCH